MTQFVEVEAGKGGTFIGEVKKDGTKTNVTAVAYYGNEFLGWYDEDDNLVSTDVNYNGVLTKTIIARFAQYNLITDGDFESGSSDTLTEYKNYPKYKETLNNVIAIGDTCIEGSGSEYGAKALYLTPDEGSSNDKIKGLLNIPVTLEKGKTYIWKFSYAFPKVAYDASKHYIQFSVDKSPLSWSGSVEYSFHVQRDSLPALDENSYTWSKNTPVTSDAAARTYNISAANEWVHMYVIFTADTNGTHYLTFGTPQSLTDTVVIDNMSLTEATNTLTSTEIAVEGDGEVVSYRADIPAYRATENCKNSTATFETKEAAPYFSQMVETYYAKPGRGYRFDGWFNAQGENVSSDFALKAFTVGEKYTAKFSVDPNKYVVNGAVETLNGTKGGYVTDTLTGEDYFSGEAVTFKAHAYKGNTFKGWYDGNKLLSKNDVYEHIIDKNATITAKFENNNLFSDSGYENYAPSANLLGSDKEWYVSGADASTEAVVVSSDCYDGTKSLFIKAPEKEIVSRTFAVEANKTYHLAFDWRSVNGDNDAALKSVKVINAETNAVLYSSPSTAAIGAEGWQKFYTNFNTGSVTSVKVIVEYSAAAGALFIDNSSLYDASKCDFKITARVDTVNGVYPGYIVGETDLSASNGDSVNVKVVPYAANTFLGWYSELVCLSTATDYTFTADSYLDLVARFDTGNIFPDAGFENTVAGVELDTVENAYFKNNVSWGSITVKESAARSGSFGVEAIHRNNEFNTILTGLKENTDYELSFWWKMRVPDTTAVFNYVDVNGVQTGKLLKTADGTVSSDEWQQIKLSFNTGRNTEIKVDYKYTSGSTGVYLDDFCLRETNDIQVLAGEGGTVQSTHIGSTEDGAVVTVTATETTGTFLGWYDYNNPQQKLSSDKSYTFTVSKSVALIASRAWYSAIHGTLLQPAPTALLTRATE